MPLRSCWADRCSSRKRRCALSEVRASASRSDAQAAICSTAQIDERLARERAAAGRLQQIGDAAAVGRDDGDAARHGVENDERLGLVLVHGRKQEDVDRIVEALNLGLPQRPQIAQIVAEFARGARDQPLGLLVRRGSGDDELDFDGAVPQPAQALEHMLDPLLARQVAQMADADAAALEIAHALDRRDEDGIGQNLDPLHALVEAAEPPLHRRRQHDMHRARAAQREEQRHQRRALPHVAVGMVMHVERVAEEPARGGQEGRIEEADAAVRGEIDRRESGEPRRRHEACRRHRRYGLRQDAEAGKAVELAPERGRRLRDLLKHALGDDALPVDRRREQAEHDDLAMRMRAGRFRGGVRGQAGAMLPNSEVRLLAQFEGPPLPQNARNRASFHQQARTRNAHRGARWNFAPRSGVRGGARGAGARPPGARHSPRRPWSCVSRWSFSPMSRGSWPFWSCTT